MSRMRQALKSLEARFPSASPPTGFPNSAAFPTEMSPASVPSYLGPLQALVDSSCAQVVVQPVIAENVRVALAQPTARPAQPSLADYLEQRTSPRPEVNETPQPAAPPAAAVAPLTTAPQVTDADAPAWKLNSPKAEATALELTIQRLLSDPKFADAYGELVDRLEQDFTQRHVANFALAAIESWRGQAELALGIAGMLAERGGDVLLIDGGGPGATLSFELGHARSPGLSQWFTAPSSWSKWIQPTSLRNLFFLPAGTGELQADADWPQALQSLRGTFRQVVINAIEAPAPRLELLTRSATATYLTVPLGLAETLPAQQTLARLRSKGARVLGCIAAQAASS
jgi:Mrp family chromosome partitioning ATPase